MDEFSVILKKSDDLQELLAKYDQVINALEVDDEVKDVLFDTVHTAIDLAMDEAFKQGIDYMNDYLFLASMPPDDFPS